MFVKYGSVEMELVNIDLYQQELVKSEDNVDVLYYQTTFKFTNLINPGYYYESADGVQNTNTVKTINYLTKLLMEPRQPMIISFSEDLVEQNTDPKDNLAFSQAQNNNPFIFDGPFPQEINQNNVVPHPLNNVVGDIQWKDTNSLPVIPTSEDCNNGPIPLFCNITKVIGNNGFSVSWAVRTWTRAVGRQVLLSNRFTMRHQVDGNQLCTITTFGEAVFDPIEVLKLQKVPDNFRDIIIPPIYSSFYRENITVEQSSNGCKLNYVTVDHQMPVVVLQYDNNPEVEDTGILKYHISKSQSVYTGDPVTGTFTRAMSEHNQYKANQLWKEQMAREHDAQTKQLEKRAAYYDEKIRTEQMRQKRYGSP